MRRVSQRKGPLRNARPMLLACKSIIQEHLPDATVVLFGSRARGAATPESDYDLLVLTAAKLTAAEEDRISDAVYELELERGVVISLLFFARDDWDYHSLMPLHQDVDREGITL